MTGCGSRVVAALEQVCLSSSMLISLVLWCRWPRLGNGGNEECVRRERRRWGLVLVRARRKRRSDRGDVRCFGEGSTLYCCSTVVISAFSKSEG